MTSLADVAPALTPADTAAPVRSAFWTAPRDGYPARPDEVTWPQTALAAGAVTGILANEPFLHERRAARGHVRRGLSAVLAWLGDQPGETWQQRWLASGVEKLPGRQWTESPETWALGMGLDLGCAPRCDLSSALLMMTCADIVRPSLRWFFTRASTHLAPAMARTRDPEGFKRLRKICDNDSKVSRTDTTLALTRIACIMGAKGGLVADITVGDCLELIDAQLENHAGGGGHKESFYRLLRAVGALSPDAPVTLRMFKPRGQFSPEELVDRYRIQCGPVRDLLVDYLRERQPQLDYTTLYGLSTELAGLFWRDLELHHPGISSLQLPPEAAMAWKERIAVKTVKIKDARGHVIETTQPRETRLDILTTVRSFYLDIAQWAVEEPARWGPWAVPCPIRESEIDWTKAERLRKAKTSQRTRERLPVLPVLVRTAERRLTEARERLDAARQAEPGQTFTVGGQTLLRPVLPHGEANKVWAVDPDAETNGGPSKGRRDLILEEEHAFWAWAAIEVMRHTGIRREELLELSHHSFVQYRLRSTGEVVPLLQVAPSKTDQERLILVVPELADVLSAIVHRIRQPGGGIPVIPSYDRHERTWLPPMPLLFQRPVFTEHRPLSTNFIQDTINRVAAASGLSDSEGMPLRYAPHDFRRLFVTDAIMNGLPPHIAQVICGHGDINTTMGYKAVYPQEAIEAHRLFIATRRSRRPPAEYRTPTDQEWDEFLAHFEKRKVSVGTCARAFGTPCIHEHACIRCSMLRPDPAQMPRLVAIRDNLIDRIAEAEREGWLGEIEGLQVSLLGAEEKIALAESSATPRTVHLGIPTVARPAPEAPGEES